MQTIKSLQIEVFDLSGKLIKPDPRHEFSDLVVIALTLASKYMPVDSENWLFHKIKFHDGFVPGKRQPIPSTANTLIPYQM